MERVDGQLFTIGEMSRRTGVNIETIRYYERVGVMPKPRRTEGGHRAYDHDQLKRLHFVRRSRQLGFSLNEVRAMLRLVDDGALTCGEIHAMTMDHLADIKQKVSDLQRLETALGLMAAECSRGDIPDCPIIETLFGDVESG
ncbi:MAG: helix-turn-helix domain-containing protein [Paracoccaceae bacterium]